MTNFDLIQTIRQPLRTFTRGGSNSAKFCLILDFKALQFQNEAMYLTPNTTEGVPMTGVCNSPKIWRMQFGFPSLRNWDDFVVPQNVCRENALNLPGRAAAPSENCIRDWIIG